MLPQTGCSSPAPCPAYGGQGAGQGRVYISSSPSHQAGGGAGAGRGRAGESRGRARHCSSSGPCGHHGNLATVAAEWNPAQHRCHQHRVSGGAVSGVYRVLCCVTCVGAESPDGGSGAARRSGGCSRSRSGAGRGGHLAQRGRQWLVRGEPPAGPEFVSQPQPWQQ